MMESLMKKQKQTRAAVIHDVFQIKWSLEGKQNLFLASREIRISYCHIKTTYVNLILRSRQSDRLQKVSINQSVIISFTLYSDR